MGDAEAEAILDLERRLTDWMRQQPATAEWSLMALGISAPRLIFGIGALNGDAAGADAARLLDNSVSVSLRLFRQAVDGPPAIH
jgi:hypothetical protein